MKLFWKTRCLPAVFSLALAAVIGCGGSARTLSGEVSLDGQPIDEGTISFVPVAGGGDSGHKVSVQIINGKYVVDAARNLASGKYRVEISWLRKTGKKAATGDGKETQDVKKEALPPKFNSQSTLTAEVPAPGDKLDFPLKSN